MPSAYLRELQNGLDPARRLYQIVAQGMCIGCGICQSIHACVHEQLPTFGERFISRSRADVLEAAGSRYGPTAARLR